MRINQSTIGKYRLKVDALISLKKWDEALSISSKYPLGDGYVICKSRLKSKYEINDEDLSSLSQVSKNNPHYSFANRMTLFLEQEVKERFKPKTNNKN